MRLDLFLVSRGDYDSRNKAAAAIKSGAVSINEIITRRAAQIVSDGDAVVCASAPNYVSRAAVKLAHGLAHFGYDVAGKRIGDIGASTGGFTQTLLQAGAAHVFAIDVGHDQLAPTLCDDARVSNMQGVNVRDLDASLFEGNAAPFDALVCDVSFISLKLALPRALAMIPADKNAWVLALIKPQFEVGREGVGKGGIVREAHAHKQVCDDIAAWFGAQGWRVDGVIASPISGVKGNAEFLIGAQF